MTLALHGSYFRYNFGDTLLCRLFCDWLHEASPGEDIVLPIADARNQVLIGAQKRGILANTQARALLFCGGGYFSEPADGLTRWSLRAYLRHIWLAERAMAKNIPYAILGVGAGPLTKPWLRERVRKVFENAQVVVVRDPESLAFLTELGVKRPVAVAMDAAIGISPQSSIGAGPANPKITAAKSKGQRVLLIHTNSHPTAKERQIVEACADWAASRPDVYAVFADDSVSRKPVRWIHDVPAARPALADRYASIGYDGNPDSLANLLRTVDSIVTTKLHVGIVGSALERHVISVPKHSKTPRFYRQVGLSQQCMDLGDNWRDGLLARLDAWHAGETNSFEKLREVRAQFSYPDAVKAFVAAI